MRNRIPCQRDAGTRLATALRRRPFSACNKGNRRRLHAGNCIAWYKHERGWENSRQLCKPETKSRVCITVENSPNASSVYIRLCKHRKKVFYCFYKITFPRKTQNSLLWNWLKEKFLPVAKSCPRRLARVISSCFAKRCFSKYEFFSLKMSA